MKSSLPRLVLSLATCLWATQLVCAHSAIESAPRNEGWWQDRHKLINTKATEAGDKAQVIFIGDSITQGWEGEGKEVWAQYYAKRNAVNLGISGDRTQHVLWRLDHGNVEGIHPKAAVVMIGTNNSNGEDNTPGQIVEGVTAIVKKLREKLPQTKVVLVAIFPRSENFSAQRGKIMQINQVLHKLADNKDVFWADFGHRFINNDGTIPGELMPDYLHLSKRGYAIWAEAIERLVARLVGDEPVKPETAQSVSLNGEWVSTLRSNDGQTFESRLQLQNSGKTITGKFSRGDDKWLQIENGELNDNNLSWTIKRDRPDGSILTYRMTGKVDGAQITGVAKAQIDGQEQSMVWNARRK